MVDKNPDWKIGEYARGAMLESCELSGAITTADIGKALKATGVNSDGQLKVELQTGALTPVGVAIIETVGAIGDLRQILIRGDVKIRESDGAIVAGGAITVKDAKFIAAGTATTTFEYPVGFSRAVFAAAGSDQGLICFSGP